MALAVGLREPYTWEQELEAGDVRSVSDLAVDHRLVLVVQPQQVCGHHCTFSFSLSSLCVPLSASLPLSLSLSLRCCPLLSPPPHPNLPVLQIPWCGLLMPSEDHETEPSVCLVFCGRTVFSVPSSHVHRYCVSGVVTAAAQCLLLLSKGQGQLPRASPTAPQSPLRLPYVRYTTVTCCAGTGTTVDPAVLQVVRARQDCVHYCIVRGFLLFQTAVRLMLALHNGQFPAVATAWELPRVLRYCVGRGNPFSTGPKKQFNAWWVRVLDDAEEEFKSMPIKKPVRSSCGGTCPVSARCKPLWTRCSMCTSAHYVPSPFAV